MFYTGKSSHLFALSRYAEVGQVDDLLFSDFYFKSIFTLTDTEIGPNSLNSLFLFQAHEAALSAIAELSPKLPYKVSALQYLLVSF